MAKACHTTEASSHKDDENFTILQRTKESLGSKGRGGQKLCCCRHSIGQHLAEEDEKNYDDGIDRY